VSLNPTFYPSVLVAITVLALEFMYYLGGQKATLISVSNDISIQADGSTLPSSHYYMLTIILQLRRWSESGCRARVSHLVHQLRLESRRSLRECLFSAPTMDPPSYPVGLRKLLTFTARKHLSTPTENTTTRLAWLFAHRLTVAIWVPYFAVFETLVSFSTAIWISCLGLVFDTLQIVIPRKQNQPLLGENENTWGFGQLVPLILLLQPFSVVWEHLVVVSGKPTEERPDSRNTTTSSETTTHKDNDSHTIQQTQPSGSLLEYLKTDEPVRPADRHQFQPTPIEQLVLRSSLFYINVYLVQPAILIAAILAFTTDAYLIGYSTTGNWSYFCIVLAVYVDIAWLSTFSLLPWVALGKRPVSRETACNVDLG
jgi:hypothetical protein